uniref:Uncharacterized protein n=1 Tax=viral metagenome TaxID=1070528 RepID=A0A6M3Y4H8_9ZZZZ
MALRNPLTRVATFSDDNDTGTGSVTGAILHTFQLPQDTDNVVVKFTGSVVAGGLSAILQTTDDGGTTYYDCARTSIITNATNAKAEWLSVPVIGAGVKTAATYATGSIVSMGIGNAESLQLPQRAVSGLPILDRQARVAIIITGDVTSAASNNCDVTVMTNSQSATA